MLLASNKGRDTKQKLNRVESLPIGENRPFKRISGKARNDNLRDWIERSYDTFRLIRQGATHLVDHVNPAFVRDIQSLPELTKWSARRWAVASARHALEGLGGTTFAGAFGIDLSRETDRRRRRKEATFRKKFDEPKLLRGDPKQWSLVQRGNGTWASFVIQDKLGNRGGELDGTEATEFEHQQETIRLTAPTSADKLNTLADVIEQRLLSV